MQLAERTNGRASLCNGALTMFAANAEDGLYLVSLFVHRKSGANNINEIQI